MNNWNQNLWIIFWITVISSIGWFSTVDALLHNIASLFGQTNTHNQNRVSPRFNVERHYKSPQRSIKSIKRCFCIEHPPSELSERFLDQRHFTVGKMPIEPEITKSITSRSQLSLSPSIGKSYNQHFCFPRSVHAKVWRKGTNKSTSRKKCKRKKMQKSRIFHLLDRKQKHKAWKKLHPKILGHLKRVKHRDHHRLKFKRMKCEKSRSRKHALNDRKIPYKYKPRKGKRSKLHKLHYVKSQAKSRRKHENKLDRSKSSISRFSSTPFHHYHFYKCTPIQHISQKFHDESLFFRKPIKKYQDKLKTRDFYRKKRYEKKSQRSISQRLPAYKVKRSYTTPGLSRAKYVYNTSKRQKNLVPRVSTFYRRMGNRMHYQKAYGAEHIKKCAACRHLCPYDHYKYNTSYGRTRYANFIRNQQLLGPKRKWFIGSPWRKRSNPYFESYMNHNNFSDSQSKRYAPYMFYQQRLSTSFSPFQSRFYRDQQLPNQYSENTMGYQYRDTMFPTRTSVIHSYPPYYYYSNAPYQYPLYNPLYSGLGMQSTNIPMNRTQEGGTTSNSYLKKAANFMHGIFSTEKHGIKPTNCPCKCPKSRTLVIHNNTNPILSSTSGLGTNLDFGTCTKSGTTLHSLQELARLTENIDKIQHTALKPLIEKNHQLTSQRANSLCKIIQ